MENIITKEIQTLSENKTLNEILSMFYVGLEDFENPELTFIKNNNLPNHYIMVSQSTNGINSIRTLANSLDLKGKQTKVKAFSLEFEFIVVSVKETETEIMFDSMSLMELMTMAKVSEELKSMWSFDEPVFSVYSFEEVDSAYGSKEDNKDIENV